MGDYRYLDMCPLTQVSLGGGGGIGFDIQAYQWQHLPCIRSNCRLWAVVLDPESGDVLAEGCNLSFFGRTSEEIAYIEEARRVPTQARARETEAAIARQHDAVCEELTNQAREQSDRVRDRGDNASVEEVFELGRLWALLFDQTQDSDHRSQALQAMRRAKQVDPEFFDDYFGEKRPFGSLMQDPDFAGFA